MTEPQTDDVYSQRTIRIVLAAIALALAASAVFLVDGWLVWLLAALAAIVGCAAITPPFRHH